MFTIHYKVSTNLRTPNSKSIIRKPWAEKPIPWAENRSLENCRKKPKKKSGALTPSPQIRVTGTVLVLMHQKLTSGALVGYPPPVRHASCVYTSQGRGQTPCKEYNTYPT